MELKDIYNLLVNSKSDINEHLTILKEYAQKCEHITEFGTRAGVSTIALMSGFPKKIITYDIDRRAYDKVKSMLISLAENNHIDFIFENKNVLDVEIEETNLLFIDTEHTYYQLYSELTKHAKNVKNYILMHDTESRAYVDVYWYFNKTANNREDKRGLVTAYSDFLFTEEGSNWEIDRIYKNNNGLTILKRK